MFKEINNFEIKINNLAIGNIYYLVPNIISIIPLNDLFLATEWLVNEAINDYENIFKFAGVKLTPHQYIDGVNKFGIRLGSRTQGYVNQLCLMEDILKYEYKRMIKLVREASDNGIILDSENDYKKLIERFTKIRDFRNKVVAHTAYTYPKINIKTGIIEDNPMTIVDSMLNLFPDEAQITLGNNSFSGISEFESQIPTITIYNWETEIRPIFEDWKKLFIEKLKEVHAQCPIRNNLFSIEVIHN